MVEAQPLATQCFDSFNTTATEAYAQWRLNNASPDTLIALNLVFFALLTLAPRINRGIDFMLEGSNVEPGEPIYQNGRFEWIRLDAPDVRRAVLMVGFTVNFAYVTTKVLWTTGWYHAFI